MGLFDLNFTDSDESDSAVSDGEEQIPLVRSKKPIALNPEPTTDTSSTEPKGNDVKMQETSHRQEDEVADDVEDEEEEDELPLRRPVKETVKPTAAAAASTTTKAKAKNVVMEMEGNFNKYGKWKREEKEKVVPCTLSFGCILEARHADLCICPFDQSKGRKCKPTSFAPPTRRVQRPKKRAKTDDKTDTVVLAAVEIPASAPQVEVPSSEDDIVASLVSLKKGPATSSSVMTMRTESTGASSAGPSTVTTEDNIKELAKLLASLPEEDSKIELELMHAIAKKYQLQPGNVAK